MTSALKTNRVVWLALLLIAGCKSSPSHEDRNIAVANKFIDAFYSFDRDSLEALLSSAGGSQPSILYYQKWAECGTYEVVKRSDCMVRNDSLVTCPVTVKDDLMAGLKIDFNVTDSFHLTIIEGKIRSVETSSNDPEVYYEAKEWVKQNRPELVEGPCQGIWAGGPTPCECVRGMVKGFAEFSTR